MLGKGLPNSDNSTRWAKIVEQLELRDLLRNAAFVVHLSARENSYSGVVIKTFSQVLRVEEIEK